MGFIGLIPAPPDFRDYVGEKISVIGDSSQSRIEHSGSYALKRGWLIFLALGVQFLAISLLNEIHFGVARAMLIASYVILFFALAPNIRRLGIAVVFVGALLNFIVIAVNGGSMPIDPRVLGMDAYTANYSEGESGYLRWSKDTLQLSENTRLGFLSDVFSLPGPLKLIYSAGDVFIVVGILIYVLHLIVTRRRPRDHLCGTNEPRPLLDARSEKQITKRSLSTLGDTCRR